MEKLEKDKTTLDDISKILNAKREGTEKNQIISEIIKELKLSKEKIEALNKCLDSLKSEIESKDNPFDYILDAFVNTSNELVRDFVETFIHGSTEEDKSRAEELHIDFLLTSIVSETFFGQIERKRCPVITYVSGSLAGKNLTVKMPKELSEETYSSIVNVCGHDSFPYYSSLDGESKREGCGTTDYLNGCRILWTDEQQGERKACYYEIEEQPDGTTTYSVCRTRSDVTLDEMQKIPCSERYKVSMKKADKPETEYESDVGAIDASKTSEVETFEGTTKPSVGSSEALVAATAAVTMAATVVAANLVVNANLFDSARRIAITEHRVAQQKELMVLGGE